MLVQAHEDLWAAVREELRSRLGDKCFERWVVPLRLLSREGNEVRLAVDDGVLGSWIEARYLSDIVSAFRQRLGGCAQDGLTVRLIQESGVPMGLPAHLSTRLQPGQGHLAGPGLAARDGSQESLRALGPAPSLSAPSLSAPSLSAPSLSAPSLSAPMAPAPRSAPSIPGRGLDRTQDRPAAGPPRPAAGLIARIAALLAERHGPLSGGRALGRPPVDAESVADATRGLGADGGATAADSPRESAGPSDTAGPSGVSVHSDPATVGSAAAGTEASARGDPAIPADLPQPSAVAGSGTAEEPAAAAGSGGADSGGAEALAPAPTSRRPVPGWLAGIPAASGPQPGGPSEAPPAAPPRRRSSPAGEQSLESFVVGRSNHLAHSAALEVLGSPGAAYNPLFVHGASGVGKTHLLRGLARSLRSRRYDSAPWRGSRVASGPSMLTCVYVTGEQFFNQYSMSIQDGTARRFRDRYRSLDVLIVDDVQLLINKRKTQVEFLHTFSALVESGRQIILASDVPPKGLKDLDQGLVGRFLSGLVVGMGKPDYTTRLGILREHSGRLGNHIQDGILEFVAAHVRGNVRELIGALMKLDIHAQLNGGVLRLEEARELMSEFASDAARRIDLGRIRDTVAGHFGIAPETLISSSRQRHVTLARQIAMFIARRHTKESLASIGKYFGKRDHATVKCAADKIARLLDRTDENMALQVRAILDALED